MYVLKIDLPTGVVYFTGKKKRIQDCESPGLTEDISLARIYEDEEEAKKFCKMLIRKYDMDFYYSSLDDSEAEEVKEEEQEEAEEQQFELGLKEEIAKAIAEDDTPEDDLNIGSGLSFDADAADNDRGQSETDPFGDSFKVNLADLMDDDGDSKN